ncbi:MAG: hypothetical protein N3D82_00580 [Ignisphaera sp.]|nr:hypothetical protein [Ignisphaera sp.]MCX8167512.1 hypothetical protein [Ignisphaera sp.]MDW8084625.1 hypothetical protein [Ignisphaera sp.]
MLKIARSAVVLFITMLSISIMETYTQYAAASSTHFQLISYSFKSSAGTNNIYPGSRNVELSVNIQYVSENSIVISAACLEELPEVFTISRGASPCSPPYSPNNTVVNIVKQKDVIAFKYRLDVGSNAVPRSYSIGMRIHYREIDDGSTPGAEYIEITLWVEQYPEVSVDIIDWYWSPEAYPGSQNVYLYIVLRNIGEATLIRAEGVANLQHTIFTPSSMRFTVSSLSKYATATISLGPLSVSSNALPHTQYIVELALYATMGTEDGVVYTSNVMRTFSITLSTPPPIDLEVLDYGFESAKLVENTVQVRFYATIMNKDFKTIRSMIVYYSVLTPGVSFINGTKSAISIHNQLLNYGDTLTLYSSPLVIGSVDRVSIELKLVIFGDESGAEFWCEKRYGFTVSISKPYTSLSVVDSYWVDREVYPGSENAALSIVLENYDVVDVRDVIATLELPENFYPKIIKLTGTDIARGSRVALIFSGISISDNVKPGMYRVKLDISGISVVNVNTFYKIQSNYTLMVRVSTPPNQTILDVVGYGWLSGRAYVNSIGARIYAYFMVVKPGYRIQNPTLTVYLPRQMMFQSLNRSFTTVVSGGFEYGQAIYVEVPNIDVVACSEGMYPVVIRLRALVLGSQSFWYDKTYTLLMPLHSPKLNVTLIDKGWRYGVASPKMSGASVYLTLQSLNIDTLNTIIVQLEFDGIDVKFVNGGNRSIVSIAGPINYGNTFAAIFTDIEVNNEGSDGKIVAKVLITSIIQSYGMYYTATDSYILELGLLSELKTFVIGAIHTEYGNTYAPILPSARGVLINIDIVNTKVHPIAWMRPIAYRTPPTVKINDASGTCLYGIAASGTCTIILNIDVKPSAQPHNYSITLEVEYGVQNGDAIAIYSDRLEIPIAIASYEYYRPTLRLASWYWGIQAPIRALEGQRNVPLTLVVVNNGPYPVSGVEVELEPKDKGITLINEGAVCAPMLNVGGSCLVTFYVDLSNASTNILEFHADIRYMFTLYGANVDDRVEHIITLHIDRGASGSGLEVIDWGWTNNWPAYPHTDNATYFISAINNWPFRVSGIKLMLSLPTGFSSKGEDKAVSYIPGPIGSLQQFTATFQVSIGDIKPGRYSAVLTVEYVVETGTPNTAIIEKHPISILVNDPSSSISVVLMQWIGAMPEPGTYGATLAVVLRNNYNPLIKGAVLELDLPKGFTYSATNQSHAKVPATNINLIDYSRISPSYYQLIMNYVSQIVQQTGTGQSFEHGSLLNFYIKLNVLVDRPGVYRTTAYLNFIDHWNCIRRLPLEINITVLGSTKIIDIDSPIKVRVSNGTSLLSIGIRNTGSSPLYNVYIYLIPYTSILLPDGNIKYIDVLPPNDVVHISYTLIYNPVAIAVGAAQTYMRYMSVPFGVAIVYRDASGYMQYLNTSLSVLLEPFIDLRLEDLRATISGGVLRVSGIIVNYGIATARSVEARVKIDGTLAGTLIGDIDSASQSVFRIETRVDAMPNNLTLYIIYRDEYYIENVLERKVSVTIEAPPTTYTPQQAQPLQLTHILIVIAVSLFLLTMALVLHRYMRRIASLQQSVYKG